MSGRVGKDSEYKGGEACRKLGNFVDDRWGRDSPISKAGHTGMHLYRAAASFATGDRDTAKGEWNRAWDPKRY